MCQFHQRFTCSFYARGSQKSQTTLLTYAHSGSARIKAARKTLMKLTPGRDDLLKLQPFPLITRLMEKINEIGMDEKIDRFQKIVRHISDLMIMTQAATKHLREFI